LAVGYWLLAIGYWLLAIGYWLLAILAFKSHNEFSFGHALVSLVLRNSLRVFVKADRNTRGATFQGVTPDPLERSVGYAEFRNGGT
jgi:hypothetical protein